jgi:hypothetical protein
MPAAGSRPSSGGTNDEHHHSSLALFTPADVFFGRIAEVGTVRQAALDAAYDAHPRTLPPRRTSRPPPTLRGEHQPDHLQRHHLRFQHHSVDGGAASLIDFENPLSQTR